MSLDQRLTSAARQVAEGVVPPEVDLDVVRARARRNRRRTIAQAIVVCVMAGIVVGTAVSNQEAGLSQTEPTAPSPASTPSTGSALSFNPGSMTPEAVVKSAGAQVRLVGVAPGNTDIRVAIWEIAGYRGMALTADGFRTVTYAAAPEGASHVVSSPKDGVFLLASDHNDEWLVDVQGRVRQVTRVVSELRPADPRLWYQCGDGSWRANWCSLDLDSATAHLSSTEWGGSAVRPGLGAAPWGVHPEPRAAFDTGRLEAWWYAGGERQVRTVAKARDGDYVAATPPGEMAFWAPGTTRSTIDVHTSSAVGTGWAVRSYAAPEIGQYEVREVLRSPDGALLMCTGGETVVVSRAEATGRAFREVYRSPSLGIPCQGFGTQGSFVYLNADDVAAVSRDGGRTWTTIETWR